MSRVKLKARLLIRLLQTIRLPSIIMSLAIRQAHTIGGVGAAKVKQAIGQTVLMVTVTNIQAGASKVPLGLWVSLVLDDTRPLPSSGSAGVGK